MSGPGATRIPAAPQHGPRPLPLFIDLLRSETAASPERRAAALTGLRAFQEAPRGRPRKPAPARYRRGRARLRDYGGDGPPVVLVPSLINPPDILDHAPGNSLAGWLATQGMRPLLVDWGAPTPAEREQDVGRHVADLLVPLIAKLPQPPVLVGYCLGGTMATAAASLTPVAGLATIAAPWRFAGYTGKAEMMALWQAARPVCDTLGLVPMELLQSGFWRLDPARTIAKYEAFGRLDPASDQARGFIRLEDWANDGAPLTFAAGRQLFEEFIAADTPGNGDWSIGGRRVGPAALACPAIEFVSLTDRIVPAATAAGLPDRHDLGAGHVGMVVGSRARAQMWEPLRDWIAAVQQKR